MSNILQEAVQETVKVCSGELFGYGISLSSNGPVSFSKDKKSVKMSELLLNNMKAVQVNNLQMKHKEEQNCSETIVAKIQDNGDASIRMPHSKPQLNKTKSLPSDINKCQYATLFDKRQFLNPDIIIFPDVKVTADPITYLSNMSNRNGNSSNSQSESIEIDMAAVPLPLKGPKELMKNFVTGTPCISEKYFANMIDELVRTKKYLYNMKMQERKLDKYEEQLQPQKSAPPVDAHAVHVLKRVNSFEIDDEEMNNKDFTIKLSCQPKHHHQKCCTEVVRKYATMVNDLQSSNEELLKERDQLKEQVCRENIVGITSENENLKMEIQQLTFEYSQLKSCVKMMSQCLQEEKSKNKDAEGLLKQKMDEVTKLVEQIGRLRQQHEELQMEKDALEKRISLSFDYHYQSACNRRRSSDCSYSAGSSNRERLYIATLPYHSNQPIMNVPVHSVSISSESKSGSEEIPFNIAPENISEKLNQNNLSHREEKVLNLPDGKNSQSMMMMCPRCLQMFIFEPLYMEHLNKCIE